LQGIEQYGNGVIAYSLGNFVADMWQSRMRESMILDCMLSNNGIHGVGVVPIRINGRYQPEILPGAEGEKLINKTTTWRKELAEEDFSRSEEDMKRYRREVRLNTGLYRLQCYLYFLTHLWRYQRSIVLSSFRRFVLRRLEIFGLNAD
jgi:hypothetical protein